MTARNRLISALELLNNHFGIPCENWTHDSPSENYDFIFHRNISISRAFDEITIEASVMTLIELRDIKEDLHDLGIQLVRKEGASR